MRWNFCSKFILEIVYQTSSESPEFCRRYYKNILVSFFLDTRCCITLQATAYIILTIGTSYSVSSLNYTCKVWNYSVIVDGCGREESVSWLSERVLLCMVSFQQRSSSLSDAITKHAAVPVPDCLSHDRATAVACICRDSDAAG